MSFAIGAHILQRTRRFEVSGEAHIRKFSKESGLFGKLVLKRNAPFERRD